MKQIARLKDVLLRASAVLFVLVMLSFCIMSCLLARYTSNAQGGDSAKIASFSVNPGESYSSPAVSFYDMEPGITKSYDFSIKSESEVAVRCNLTIETTGNLPLEFYVDGHKINTDGTYVEFATIAPNADEETFALKAVWQSGKDDVSYLDEIDAVRLIVTAEQID